MALIDLVQEYHNVLDSDTCNQIIERFDNDKRKYEGFVIGEDEGKQVKRSTDLSISSLVEWKDIDNLFFDIISKYRDPYLNLLKKTWHRVGFGKLRDDGYQIQCTKPGGFYHWHSDDTVKVAPKVEIHTDSTGRRYIPSDTRIYTYILYLNDVDVMKQGGRTQFYLDGEIHNITPEAGKLLLFPADIIFTHRGETLTDGVKYLMTGWVSENSSVYLRA